MSRLFVVIPAAGHSRRMGEPKLLIDLGGKPIIVHLLETLQASSAVSRIVIVARSDDTNLLEVLEQHAHERLTVITPTEDPPEMRDSVELALAALDLWESPTWEDSWALLPADHPLITPETFQKVCQAWKDSSAEIFIPTVNETGGHPTFFRWPVSEEVAKLSSDEGLNSIVRAFPSRVVHWPTDANELLFDLDTPEDLERVRQWWSQRHMDE
ncbi:nucleotidyltransferase family protein [Planctomycetaceae bacterium]|nr:nucleotidyltransferase family protein [Planctomycetaceae bacterium]